MSNQRFGLTLVITVGCVLAWACATLLDGGRATATSLLTPTASTTQIGMATPAAATPTTAPQQEVFQRVGGLGGESITLALSGTLALVGEGYRLVAYDVSNPAQPFKKGVLLLPATPRVIRIAGNRALVGHDRGTHVVDIGDAAHMTTLLVIDTVSVQDIQLSGSLVYILTYSSLFSVDLADISHPVFGRDIYVYGKQFVIGPQGIIYVSGYDGIKAVDVSDPAHPSMRGSLSLDNYSQHIALSGSYIWLAGYDKILAIDIHNPDQLRFASAYNTEQGYYTALQIAGSQMYAAYTPENSSTISSIEVIDISTPLSPTLQAQSDIQNNVYDLAINGSEIYAVGSAGLIVLSHDPQPIDVIGQVANSGPVVQVLSDGSRMFVRGSRSLSIYPRDDVSAPAMLGSYLSPFYLSDGVVVGDVAYLAAGSSGGLLIVDVSAGHAPSLLGRVITPGNAINLDVENGFAYIADSAGGLVVVDVRVPNQPTIVGRFTETRIVDVLVQDNVAYVVANYDQLLTIDVTNPAQPTLIETAEPLYTAKLYEVADGLLYAFDSSSGYSFYSYVMIIDVRNPAQLQVLGKIPIASYAQNIVVEGTRVFLLTYAGDSGGIEVVDVSTPEHPVPLTRTQFDISVSVYASGLAVVNQSIYVGMGTHGALIFNFDPSLLHPSSMLLPVVIQGEPFSFPTYETPTPWDVAYTAQPTSTATSPEATVTPCRVGCMATPTPLIASPQLAIDIEDDQPTVGDNLLAYGDIVDAANTGVANIQVVVTYSFEGGSGQWCQATTDSDGYWECSATVTTVMQDKQVTLAAQATIGGMSIANEVVFQPR